jgi:hypothetical protein
MPWFVSMACHGCVHYTFSKSERNQVISWVMNQAMHSSISCGQVRWYLESDQGCPNEWTLPCLAVSMLSEDSKRSDNRKHLSSSTLPPLGRTSLPYPLIQYDQQRPANVSVQHAGCMWPLLFTLQYTFIYLGKRTARVQALSWPDCWGTLVINHRPGHATPKAAVVMYNLRTLFIYIVH